MFRYKPDQGVYARGTTFWVLSSYATLAGYRFHLELQRFDWANRRFTEGNVPVLGFPLTPCNLLGLVVCLCLIYGVWWLVNFPRLTDLLIDTEQELRKITWPNVEDSKNASVVVLGCVVFMLVFLGLADLGFAWFFARVIY